MNPPITVFMAIADMMARDCRIARVLSPRNHDGLVLMPVNHTTVSSLALRAALPVLGLLGLVALLLSLAWQLQELIVVLLFALLLSSALLPLCDRLDRAMPRWLAVFLPFLGLMLIMFLLVIPVSTLAVDQLNQFVKDLPSYIGNSQALWHQLAALQAKYESQYPILAAFSPSRFTEQAGTWATQFLGSFTGATLAASKVFLNGVTVLIFSVLILIERETMVDYLLRFIPTDRHPMVRDLIHQLTRGMGGFANGQLIQMVIAGVMTGIGLACLGFPFALLFGVLTGVFTGIPLVGPILVMVPAMALGALTAGDFKMALWVALLFIGTQAVLNNVIGPVIMSRAVGLHPLALMIGIVAGGMLYGLVGIVLAIPVLIGLNVLLNTWVTASAVNPQTPDPLS
jgi:predicted PurR-regulated permease PerM